MIAQRCCANAARVFLQVDLHTVVRRTLYNKVKPLAKDCIEVEIKVPWGKVAGKLWGSENKQPLLAMHGWQDNAGSFDIIAPLLTKNIPVLAIDLPGHGLSSWIPPGSMYHEITYLLVIQRLRRYFGWDKVKILAHSLSAQISFWHASYFPDETEFVIALDALKFPASKVAEHRKLFTKSVSKFFELEKISTPNIRYTEKEIMNRWMSATNNSIDEKSCKILLKRAVLQTDDGKYILRRDPRLKLVPFLNERTHDYVLETAELITCPYLAIKGENSPYFEDKKYYYETLELMMKKNKNVQYVRVPGKHHFHMTNVETVAAIVNTFLEKYNIAQEMNAMSMSREFRKNW